MATVTKLLLRLSKSTDKSSIVIDLTAKYGAGGSPIFQEVSGYDQVSLQVIGLSVGTLSFKASHDDGSVTGTVVPNPPVPANFTPIGGLNVATGVIAVSTTASGMWQFPYVMRFLQIV